MMKKFTFMLSSSICHLFSHNPFLRHHALRNVVFVEFFGEQLEMKRKVQWANLLNFCIMPKKKKKEEISREDDVSICTNIVNKIS